MAQHVVARWETHQWGLVLEWYLASRQQNKNTYVYIYIHVVILGCTCCTYIFSIIFQCNYYIHIIYRICLIKWSTMVDSDKKQHLPKQIPENQQHVDREIFLVPSRIQKKSVVWKMMQKQFPETWRSQGSDDLGREFRNCLDQWSWGNSAEWNRGLNGLGYGVHHKNLVTWENQH